MTACPQGKRDCRCQRESQYGDPAERAIRRDARLRGYLCLPGGWEGYCRDYGLISDDKAREIRRHEIT